MALTTTSQRMNNGLLKVSSHDSVSMRKGQSELMGPICCTRIPFILTMINQSHLSPLLDPYSVGPLVDPKTHNRTDAIVLFLCHDSHKPLCLWIHVLCLDFFCHNHILSHLLFICRYSSFPPTIHYMLSILSLSSVGCKSSLPAYPLRNQV